MNQPASSRDEGTQAPATKRRDAATVLLVRADGAVYWVKRARRTSFLASFHAFPGGLVDADDPSIEAAAVRELREETGVVLAPAALLPAGRFVTPPFAPVPFDTRYFLARAPGGQEPSVTNGPELESGEWIPPAAALARWRSDEAILAAPTRLALEALVATAGPPATDAWLASAAAALAARCPAEGGWSPRIELRPGIFVFPVRTPTLPPATHTNCVLVGDGTKLVAIDPASPYTEERAALDAFLETLAAEGRRLDSVLLTHEHPDHVSGAVHLARRAKVPILAHHSVKDALAGSVPVTRTLADGDTLILPADRPGARPRRIRCVLTEGHARGHLVYYEEVSKTVVAGDLVAGVGFIVVDPPEGDMAVYLRSLGILRDLGASLLVPSHGPPTGDPAGKASEFIAHRLAREAKVMAAVTGGADTLEAVVAKAYEDTPPALHGLASRSALAHLVKLEGDGRVPRGQFSRLV